MKFFKINFGIQYKNHNWRSSYSEGSFLWKGFLQPPRILLTLRYSLSLHFICFLLVLLIVLQNHPLFHCYSAAMIYIQFQTHSCLNLTEYDMLFALYWCFLVTYSDLCTLNATISFYVFILRRAKKRNINSFGKEEWRYVLVVRIMKLGLKRGGIIEERSGQI